jgi:hypothetical protein
MSISLLFSNVLGYKITGFPVRIDNAKYARNAYYFNLCFVCDAWARTVQYEPVVKKLSEYLVSICVPPFNFFSTFPLLPSSFLHLEMSLSGSEFSFCSLFHSCHLSFAALNVTLLRLICAASLFQAARDTTGSTVSAFSSWRLCRQQWHHLTVSQKLFDHVTYWGDQVKEGEMGQVCVKCEEDWKNKRDLVGGGTTQPEGKRPIGRPRHRLEDNIRTDL